MASDIKVVQGKFPNGAVTRVTQGMTWASYDAQGVRVSQGKDSFTAPSAEALAEFDRLAAAQAAPATAPAPAVQHDILADRVERLRERIADNPEGVDRLYTQVHQAERELAAYDAAHPEVVEALRAEWAAEQARREQDFRNSFIGRGLD